jgi:hypothetical protein
MFEDEKHAQETSEWCLWVGNWQTHSPTNFESLESSSEKSKIFFNHL